MLARTRTLVTAGFTALALLGAACSSSPTGPGAEPAQTTLPTDASLGVVPAGG